MVKSLTGYISHKRLVVRKGNRREGMTFLCHDLGFSNQGIGSMDG